jgi:hypothetical protein
VEDAPRPDHIPASFDLGQSYPNPLRLSAASLNIHIQYQLPVRAQVKIVIYNLAGQRVATLVDGQKAPGFYSIRWDGKDLLGKNVSSGIYFYRMEAAEVVKVRKVVLVR